MPRLTVSQQLVQAIEGAAPRSQRMIAEAAGVDNGQISRFVAGKRGITAETFDKLCEELKLELVPRVPQELKSVLRAWPGLSKDVRSRIVKLASEKE